MKPPQTRVSPGQEREALDEHIDKIANQVTLERAHRLAQDFEQEERAKQKLLRIILVGILVVVLLGLAIVFFYRLQP